MYKYTCFIDLSTVSSLSELRKNIDYQETNNKLLLIKGMSNYVRMYSTIVFIDCTSYYTILSLFNGVIDE